MLFIAVSLAPKQTSLLFVVPCFFLWLHSCRACAPLCYERHEGGRGGIRLGIWEVFQNQIAMQVLAGCSEASVFGNHKHAVWAQAQTPPKLSPVWNSFVRPFVVTKYPPMSCLRDIFYSMAGVLFILKRVHLKSLSQGWNKSNID